MAAHIPLDIIEKVQIAFDERRWRKFSHNGLEMWVLTRIAECGGDKSEVAKSIFQRYPRESEENKKLWAVIDLLEKEYLLYRIRKPDGKIETYYIHNDLYYELDSEGLININHHPDRIAKRQILLPGHSGRVKVDGPNSEIPDFQFTYTLEEYLHIPKGVPHVFKGFVREDGSLLLTITPVR